MARHLVARRPEEAARPHLRSWEGMMAWCGDAGHVVLDGLSWGFWAGDGGVATMSSAGREGSVEYGSLECGLRIPCSVLLFNSFYTQVRPASES